MSTRAEELLQHKVVRVLPLIKEHWRCEAHWANEESQPAISKNKTSYYHWMKIIILILANYGTSVVLPKPRGWCIRWRLPAQTLGEELCEGRGSGPGSRCWGRACACCMVGAALTHWGTHTQLYQQPKKLSKSSTKSGWSCGDKRTIRKKLNIKKNT